MTALINVFLLNLVVGLGGLLAIICKPGRRSVGFLYDDMHEKVYHER